ncbi:MAG: hypothetical protein JWP09_357 [Candidatus Taylorbacteria bacterium]|nr:hypothetical protein [Candidatus Taylorbacteria bacterium]
MTYLKIRFRKENQDLMNFVTSIVAYILTATLLIVYLKNQRGFPRGISVFDFFLLLFATLRLTEFFVYDKSMQFFRDLFVDIKSIEVKKNNIIIQKSATNYGIRRVVHDLLGCPWCTSIWTATFITFFHFLFPDLWILILILALSGGATMIQLITNAIGWTSEKTEQEVEKEDRKESKEK